MCSTPKNNGLSSPGLKKIDENFDYAAYNRMLRTASQRYEQRQKELERLRKHRASVARERDPDDKAGGQLMSPRES